MGIKILNTIIAEEIEGVFTPVVYGATNAGIGTYTVQTGTYYRMGDIVIVSATIAWTAHTGTGALRISGLPFPPRASYNSNVRADNLTYSGLLLCTAVSDSTLRLFSTSSGTTYTEVGMDTSATLYISVAYVAS